MRALLADVLGDTSRARPRQTSSAAARGRAFRKRIDPPSGARQRSDAGQSCPASTGASRHASSAECVCRCGRPGLVHTARRRPGGHGDLQGRHGLHRRLPPRRLPGPWRRPGVRCGGGKPGRKPSHDPCPSYARCPARCPRSGGRSRTGRATGRIPFSHHHGNASGATVKARFCRANGGCGWRRRGPSLGQQGHEGLSLPGNPLLRQDSIGRVHDRGRRHRRGRPSQPWQGLLLTRRCCAGAASVAAPLVFADVFGPAPGQRPGGRTPPPRTASHARLPLRPDLISVIARPLRRHHNAAWHLPTRPWNTC